MGISPGLVAKAVECHGLNKDEARMNGRWADACTHIIFFDLCVLLFVFRSLQHIDSAFRVIPVFLGSLLFLQTGSSQWQRVRLESLASVLSAVLFSWPLLLISVHQCSLAVRNRGLSAAAETRSAPYCSAVSFLPASARPDLQTPNKCKKSNASCSVFPSWLVIQPLRPRRRLQWIPTGCSGHFNHSLNGGV